MIARARALAVVVGAVLSCTPPPARSCSKGSREPAGLVSARLVRATYVIGGQPALLEVRLLQPPTARVTLQVQEPARARVSPDSVTWDVGEGDQARSFEISSAPGDAAGELVVGFEPTESSAEPFSCVVLPVITVTYSTNPCGNAVVEGDEACDVPGQSTRCPYGLTSCEVCNPSCRRVAGEARWCGDGVVQRESGVNEQCDGPLRVDLPDGGTRERTCRDLTGWVGGKLACTNCQVDASACVAQNQCPPGVTSCTLLPVDQLPLEGHCTLELDGRPRCFGTNALAHAPAGPFTAMSVGIDHACALNDAGAVTCWGSNLLDKSTPPAGLTWKKVVTGPRHSCGLTTAGTARCWGANPTRLEPAPEGPFADLASGDFYACAVRIDGGATCWGAALEGGAALPVGAVSSVLASGERTCWFDAMGRAQCTGAPHAGLAQPPMGLSQATMGREGLCGVVPGGGLFCASSVADPVPSSSLRVRSMSGTCAIDTAGTGQCFGRGRAEPVPPGPFSELALESTPDLGLVCGLSADGGVRCSDGARAGSYRHLQAGGAHCWEKSDGRLDCPVMGMQAPPVTLTAGWSSGWHACALRPDESVVCWGRSDDAENVAPNDSFLAVATARQASCAITVSGQLRCWGSSANGRTTPPGGTFVSIAGGPEHFCALETGGALRCWGKNDRGQAAPPSGTGWVGLTTSTNTATCAWKADGTWACWGDEALVARPVTALFGTHAALWVRGANEWEVTGRGVSINGPRPLAPFSMTLSNLWAEDKHLVVKVGNELAFLSVPYSSWSGTIPLAPGAPFDAADDGVHCYVDENRSPRACTTGGAGATLPPNVPIVSLATSGRAPCAVTADGGFVECWGTRAWRSSPSRTLFPPPHERVFASVKTACATRAGSGVLDCWGNDATTLVSGRPTGPVHLVTFSSDDTTACALRPDAGATCWGQTTAGVRQGFPMGQAWVDLALGRRHGCGVLASRDLYCFGDNAATAAKNAPPGTGWQAVASGDDFSCALDEQQHLRCWGALVVDTN